MSAGYTSKHVRSLEMWLWQGTLEFAELNPTLQDQVFDAMAKYMPYGTMKAGESMQWVLDNMDKVQKQYGWTRHSHPLMDTEESTSVSFDMRQEECPLCATWALPGQTGGRCNLTKECCIQSESHIPHADCPLLRGVVVVTATNLPKGGAA